MGGHIYSSTARTLRSETLGYSTKTTFDLFEQVKHRSCHEKMDPKNISVREARDSDVHPNTYPIILALDVTGSMREIPRFFLSTALPKIISKLIQNGCPDPALLMMAIGDSKCDLVPLQAGEFESGDEQMDMWLQRIYPEGGGGGNSGESYLLAWHFAANKTITDSFEKRNKKGILITLGDEPSLKAVTSRELLEIYGPGQYSNFTDEELLKLAEEKYDVYHFHILQGFAGERSLSYWKSLLGERCISVDDYSIIDDKISDLVLQQYKSSSIGSEGIATVNNKTEIIL